MENPGLTSELHVVEWLTITGRGLLAVIDTPHPDPSLLKNRVVRLEGKSYRVRGVEMFHPRKPGDPYSLLVAGDIPYGSRDPKWLALTREDQDMLIRQALNEIKDLDELGKVAYLMGVPREKLEELGGLGDAP